MPFYDLQPKEIVLRADFSTRYDASSEERKNNVAVAAKSLNNCFLDVGGEFSFNRTVGRRTLSRGYKPAKIIVNGEFVDGVGGGVCQVSTTLYNAALLAGLKITEVHPHSLSVKYVAASFDAMVNSGSADLRFINTTKNPIIIKTFADGKVLKIEIYGEPMKERFLRKSEKLTEIAAPEEEIISDVGGLYPDLYEGEKRIIRYSKSGVKTRGSLIKIVNDKAVETRVIRTDTYKPVRGLIVIGTAKRPTDDGDQSLSNVS